MRKLQALLMALMLLLPLLGCEDTQDDILFFYPRKDILYGQEDGVIASETKDVSGHEDDLTYLLTLYLEGPYAQELFSPFPQGTTLEQIEVKDQTICITLSDSFGQLEGMAHTIACTCIAQTCFSLSDCNSVTIQTPDSQGSAVTLTRDSVELADTRPISESN